MENYFSNTKYSMSKYLATSLKGFTNSNDEMSVDRVFRYYLVCVLYMLADIHHIDENGWLKFFMKSIIDAGGSSWRCSDTNTIFFTPY